MSVIIPSLLNLYFPTSPQVPPNDEDLMKRAIMYGGPITASIQTFGDTLNNHDDGRGSNVFMGEAAGTPASGGHAIVLFGWGSERGKDFWWARNTWGRNWPKNAKTPGIFKISRGSNRNEIESGETTLALVSNIPGVGDVKGVFPGDEGACSSISGSNSEAKRCIRVTNRDESCELKNTCRDKIVTVTKTSSNSVVSVSSSSRESCGRRIYSDLTLAPQQSYEVDGVSNCCVLEAEFGEAAASCMELRKEKRCELKNQCRDAINVKFRQGRMTTSITGSFASGSESSVDMKFCGAEYEMLTFNSRDRPVNAESCFTRSVGNICSATNRCGKAMRVKFPSESGGHRYVDISSSSRPTIINSQFCEPGAQTEEL